MSSYGCLNFVVVEMTDGRLKLSSCVVLIRMVALLQVLKNGLDKPIQIALEILDADLLRGGRSRSQ